MINKSSVKYNFGIILSLSLSLSACSITDDKFLGDALEQSGANADQIKYVLDNYDGDRKSIAEFLVCSMIGKYSVVGEGLDSIEALYKCLPNGKSWQFDSQQLERIKNFENAPRQNLYDLQNLTADYLISNIDDAWRLKETMSWNKDLSVEQFQELLLPYRSGNEKISEWREAYRKKYSNINKKLAAIRNSVDAASVVSKAIGKMRFNQQLNTPNRSALDLLEVPVGYCREDCDRTLYAMRAFGIPVAVDKMLVSPDNGKSHMWNVVYDNDDKIYRMFDNYRNPPTRDSIYDDQRSKGKIYRITTGFNFDRLDKYSDLEEVPAYLKDPHLKDVTSEYFGSNQAEIDVRSPEKDVYLGIFTSEGLQPIDVAQKKGSNKVIFKDIEPNIIYFPIKSGEKGFETCGSPFLLERDGRVHSFIPDVSSRTNVSLSRKMPVTFNLKEKIGSVIGSIIWVGKSPDGPWTELDSIAAIPDHNFYRIPIGQDKRERYIRISSSVTPKPEIGEVIVSSDSLAQGRLPLSYANKKKKGKWKNIIDGDILSWYHYVAGKKGIILHIDSYDSFNSIFIIPRNDDNYVVPGEEYELFYFDRNEWKSLGKKTAEGFDITYDVPANAVLWLRNLTKGKEEQVFICRDGKQLFNADLRKVL